MLVMRKKYAGLTDDPQKRKGDHGNPADWKVVEEFSTESEARNWEKYMHDAKGYKGDEGGTGWRYGYIYTITKRTIEKV